MAYCQNVQGSATLETRNSYAWYWGVIENTENKGTMEYCLLYLEDNYKKIKILARYVSKKKKFKKKLILF